LTLGNGSSVGTLQRRRKEKEKRKVLEHITKKKKAYRVSKIRLEHQNQRKKKCCEEEVTGGNLSRLLRPKKPTPTKREIAPTTGGDKERMPKGAQYFRDQK